MNEVRFLPPAVKYLKKIKDKELKRLYKEAIERIAENPELGKAKQGDLKGIYGYDIYYSRINYELAYTFELKADGHIVIIILAGTRENFYEQLKKYWN